MIIASENSIASDNITASGYTIVDLMFTAVSMPQIEHVSMEQDIKRPLSAAKGGLSYVHAEVNPGREQHLTVLGLPGFWGVLLRDTSTRARGGRPTAWANA